MDGEHGVAPPQEIPEFQTGGAAPQETSQGSARNEVHAPAGGTVVGFESELQHVDAARSLADDPGAITLTLGPDEGPHQGAQPLEIVVRQPLCIPLFRQPQALDRPHPVELADDFVIHDPLGRGYGQAHPGGLHRGFQGFA